MVACCPLRSNVNLSRIVRACGCCGVTHLVCSGNAKLLDKIARDGPQNVRLERHRTLAPVLRQLRQTAYRLVGLEQASGSVDLYDYHFPRRAVLVVGNERSGLGAEILQLLDDVVEIPVYGLPFSHNVATATAIALYEYCRQFPDG
ncbi:MAG: TrmH family RNA methyltransferase [Planctomycetales bacterium]|nr:TrmH family RNA methyltransferase [Planctomycetales bacterium]NIM07769.1 TrmH family RNA methyltransferase [Planctomycetales bacterium]NIN07263.1 TrmH family RNA methyltransferase [Planctomycetales bacterium]NIN76355.1 TrmH family RNA methyltransferase [Planctomycetales bacterium]NIO33564.1 TrmH family RNA methyltransferase [Planctomycetales bacterium]